MTITNCACAVLIRREAADYNGGEAHHDGGGQCVYLRVSEHVGAPTPPATRRRTTTLKTLAYTGCQACCMGPAQLHSRGLNSSHLLVPELNLRAAFISVSGMSRMTRRISGQVGN